MSMMSLAGHIRLDDNGCWNWTGAKGKRGYGHMKYAGKTSYVHRVSAHCFLRFDLSSKLQVCHRCDNRICCNPKHLFIGSNLDNIRDAVSKGRHNSCVRRAQTHCKHGHPYNEENTFKVPGGRDCRICRRTATQRWKEKQNGGSRTASV